MAHIQAVRTPFHWFSPGANKDIYFECETGFKTFLPLAIRFYDCPGCLTRIDLNTHTNPPRQQPQVGLPPPATAQNDMAKEFANVKKLYKDVEKIPPIVPQPRACECGSEAVGGRSHSTWCPRHSA